MILRWFPLPIIRLHTGLSDEAIRELYRQHHDVPPPASALPDVADLLGTTATARQASNFLSHYVRLTQSTAYRRVDVNALIVSHDLHLASRDPHTTEPTTIAAAWVLARELRSRAISFVSCECGRDHVVHKEVAAASSCPHCGASLAKGRSSVHDHTWRDNTAVDRAVRVS
ncbi:FlhC family transcriptional regulator [Azospirillum oryzae]